MPDPETVAALRRSPVADLIRARRLIAILRRVEPRERLLELVGTLAEAGVRVFEITFDAEEAGSDVDAVRRRLADDGVTDAAVGAGTVLGLERLDAAVASGAAFVVAPTLETELIRTAVDRGIPVIPGAYSPTEIAAAWAAGATFVKVFPASSLGPKHVRELRGPLPEIELIATGGVDAGNAREFLAAGCVAVGVGGALVNADPDGRVAILEAVR